MKSWRNTPDNTVTNQSGETKGEKTVHESRPSGFSKGNDRPHSSSDSCNFTLRLLPRCDGDNVCLLGHRSRGGGGRRHSADDWWKDLSVLSHNRAADNLIFQVDVEPLVITDRKQELGNVVGIQGGRLGRKPRGKVGVAYMQIRRQADRKVMEPYQ